MSTLSDHGIMIPEGSTGEIHVTCPKCSPSRKKHGEKCLAVNIEKGTWFCHHCQWAWGLAADAVEQKPVEYVRPVYKPSGLPPAVVEYFKKRGIPEGILTENQIGYGVSFKDGVGGIRFPYLKGGVVVNVKHRGYSKQFRQETGAEKCLYRFDSIAKGGETLIITEGEIDALSFQVAGYSAVTSVPDGAPAPDAKTFNSKFDFLQSAETILAAFGRVILAVDNDAPGKVLERELARRIGPEKCYRVEYPDGCKDANDTLVKHGPGALIALVKASKPYPVDGLMSVSDLKSEVYDLYDRGPNRGESTGWPSVDALYRVRAGEMTVITGIPSSGKSNFLDALAVNLADYCGWAFAVFSAENWPPAKHISSLIEKVNNAPFSGDGRTVRRMNRSDVGEALGFLERHFFFIKPNETVMSVDVILEKARVAIFRHGVQGIILDPWNEIEHLFGALSETQYISQELTKIRRFARMNAVHVWIVAHPRNLVKDKNGIYAPPTMYEISGGANWRNKADYGLCVHRPNLHDDITEIHVQKVRFREVGRIGSTKLRFCMETSRYFDKEERKKNEQL